MINKGFKVKIQLTPEQEAKILNAWKGYVYVQNWAVEKQISLFDEETLRREQGLKKGKLFLSKFDMTTLWTQELKKIQVSSLCCTGIAIQRGAMTDVCSACNRFFDNAKGKPPFKDKLAFNEKYACKESREERKRAEEEAKKTGKKPENMNGYYLRKTVTGEPVYSLYYRTGGPSFKEACDSCSLPVAVQNLTVTKHFVYISQIDVVNNKRGFQDKIRLKRYGHIPYSTTKPLKYSNPRISFDGVDWWFSVGVELPEVQHRLHKGLAIGIDMGMGDESIAITNKGEKFENHLGNDNYEKAKKRSDHLQSLLKQKENRIRDLNNGEFVPSKNYDRLKLKADKARIHLNNIKKNNQHNVSRAIVNKNPELIGLETLDIEEMTSRLVKGEKRTSRKWKNKHRSILATGMYEVQRQIEYKAGWRGIVVQRVGQFFPSTQLCNKCGYKNSNLVEQDRDWVCPECGTHHDRDVNAAINIRKEAIRLYNEGAPRKVKKVTRTRKKVAQ